MTPEPVSLTDPEGVELFGSDAVMRVISLAAEARHKQTEYEAAVREEKRANAARDVAVQARAAANVALTDAKKAYQQAVDALALPPEPK